MDLKQNVKVATNSEEIVRVEDESKARDTAQDVEITANKIGVASNKAKLVKHGETLVRHEAAIGKNTADISKLRMDFNDLSADFYEFKSVASKGIAGVAAMSQIDSVYAEVGEVFVGAGVGSFNSEGAVAIGVGYRYSEATSFRAAGSFASGDAEPVFAAGVTYTFK